MIKKVQEGEDIFKTVFLTKRLERLIKLIVSSVLSTKKRRMRKILPDRLKEN